VPFEDEWRTVDWSRPARQVHSQVRSWTGMESHGHARGELRGEVVTIKRTRLVPAGAPTAASPGTVLEERSDGLLVQCGDGPLLVVDWLEGG
jgi:methionyl-tRNA formyltransferase